jgi:GTP cyclohydrolase I
MFPSLLSTPVASLEDAFGRLLLEAEDTPRDGTQDTPERAARGWRELMAGYHVDADGLLRCFDSDGYDEMVSVAAIPFYSTCEHHLMTFHGHAHVAYVPNGGIVGLSKLARLVDAYARRLQVQERMTQQIAQAIQRVLTPRGVMVMVEAEHLCMAARGVQRPGTLTTTSVVYGLMKDDPRARGEALAMFEAARHG